MDYKKMWNANKETNRTISKMKCGFFDFKKKKQIAHAKIELRNLEQYEKVISLIDKLGIFDCLKIKPKKKKKTIKKKKK